MAWIVLAAIAAAHPRLQNVEELTDAIVDAAGYKNPYIAGNRRQNATRVVGSST